MKKIGLVIVLLTSLIAIGCSKQNVNNEFKQLKPNEEVQQQNVVNQEDDSDLSECLQLCDASSQEGFYAPAKQDCIAACKVGHAIKTKNAKICDTIEGMWQSSCYIGIVQETKDPDICKKITNDTTRHTCYVSIVEVTKDISLCKMIEDVGIRELCEQMDHLE